MRCGTFCLLLLSISIAAACADDDATAGPGGPISLERLPRALADTYCRALEPCLGSYLDLFPQPNCSANFEKQFESRSFVAINAAVEAGAVTYDASKAGACLAALEAEGCDLFATRNPPICDEALSGDVALGGACSIGPECRGEAFCDLSAGVCPGVCAERRGDGAACEQSEDCESGLTCQRSTCRAPAGPGQACGGTAGTECRTGLTCLGQDTATTNGTCGEISIVTSGKAGDACNPSAEPRKLCESPLSCVLDAITLTGMTFSCQSKSASGAACRPGFPEPCPSGEYCRVDNALLGDGTCARLPENGEACLTDSFRLAKCAQDLVCVNGNCTARKANGAACTSTLECDSEMCVNAKCAGDAFCTR